MRKQKDWVKLKPSFWQKMSKFQFLIRKKWSVFLCQDSGCSQCQCQTRSSIDWDPINQLPCFLPPWKANIWHRGCSQIETVAGDKMPGAFWQDYRCQGTKCSDARWQAIRCQGPSDRWQDACVPPRWQVIRCQGPSDRWQDACVPARWQVIRCQVTDDKMPGDGWRDHL